MSRAPKPAMIRRAPRAAWLPYVEQAVWSVLPNPTPQDSTAHAEAFAEPPRERRLPGAEVARENDEIARTKVSCHLTAPRLRGLAVGQVDAVLRHQLTRSTRARRCLFTSSTASRVSMCPTPGRITNSADGVWRTIS